MRDTAEEQIKRIAENTAAAFGATAKVTYDRNYPVMVNHDDQTEFMANVARTVVGDHNVNDDMEQTMGGEDFAFMLEARPGAYILCGNGEGAMVHHPEYNFNDEAIPAGCSLWANIIEQGMPAA